MNALELYIQRETGYRAMKAQEKQQDNDAWWQLYSEDICDKIYELGMPADFLWKHFRSQLTYDEFLFLEDHSPALWCIWTSRDRIFQMISQETRDRLAPEIAALCTLVESSTSRTDFETRWRRIHGVDQQELFYA